MQRSWLRDGNVQLCYYGDSPWIHQYVEEDGGTWMAEEGTMQLVQQYAVHVEGRNYTIDQMNGAFQVLNSRVWRNAYDGYLPAFLLDVNRPNGEIPNGVHSVLVVTLAQLVAEWQELGFQEKFLRTLEHLVILEKRGRKPPTISNDLWAGDQSLICRTRTNDSLVYRCSDLAASKVQKKNVKEGWVEPVVGETDHLKTLPNVTKLKKTVKSG